MATPSRRTFNNFLILGILAFITLINLPTYLRSQLAESEAEQSVEQVLPDGIIALMPSDVEVKALRFPKFTLTNAMPWQTDRKLSISATELANRWINLSGTEIDTDTYDKLKPGLREPATLVVDRGEAVEPLRLTYYQLPQFWLIQNWENRWLAVSVDPNYLFPFANQN
ncbi:hypothetical protein G5S52_16425 [Grimontia sp. S25]|uniref:Uncharacterized protein n=1 Tax=Grimontia sedimenti TaxID=2711294 RepID=A0A6M1RT74_9GAMM|nr:hypothetical protein [Grimontia sedimenti]NGN99177.1 hypothetical protein [Grimontia sedimenti]